MDDTNEKVVATRRYRAIIHNEGKCQLICEFQALDFIITPEPKELFHNDRVRIYI